MTINTAAIDPEPIEHDSDPEPEHLARCRDCDAGLRFQMIPRHGFIAIERYGVDVDTTFGIGESGLPLCPNGHGEMQVEDEQLPTVGEAMAEVKAEQARLPGVVLPFNFEGVYLEVEAQALLVERLKRTYDEDLEVAKDSKKAWEKERDKLIAMALKFHERRLAKSMPESVEDADLFVADEEAPARLVRCRFEQLNPSEPCPICTDQDVRDGGFYAHPDLELHAVQARGVLQHRAAQALVDRLEALGLFVLAAPQILNLPIDHLAALEAWVANAEQHPTDCDSFLDTLPAACGRPHVAAAVDLEATPDTQLCAVCGEPIGAGLLYRGDDVPQGYDEGARVGRNCIGTRKAEPEHHYPEKKKGGRKAHKTIGA